MPGPMFIPGLMPGPDIMLGADMEDTTAGSELGWLTCAELATSLPCMGPPMEVIEVSLILLFGAFPASALTRVMFWLPGLAMEPIWFMPPGPPGPGLMPMFD